MSKSIVDLPKKRMKYKPRYEKLPIRFVQRACSVAKFRVWWLKISLHFLYELNLGL